MSKAKKAVAKSFDQHIAARLRRAREMRHLTQADLGRALGLAHQQVQKYEAGTIRVSAGRLWQLCRALKVPVAFFYADLIDEEDGASTTENGVILDMTALTSTKASAVKRLVAASESDAQTIEALLARLQKTYG